MLPDPSPALFDPLNAVALPRSRESHAQPAHIAPIAHHVHSLRGESLGDLRNNCDVLVSPYPQLPIVQEPKHVAKRKRTVQGHNRDDESNRQHHDHERIDLESRRLVSVKPCNRTTSAFPPQVSGNPLSDCTDKLTQHRATAPSCACRPRRRRSRIRYFVRSVGCCFPSHHCRRAAGGFGRGCARGRRSGARRRVHGRGRSWGRLNGEGRY